MLCYTFLMVMHKQAPTLDRRAILGIAAPGDFNNCGEFEHGAVTEHGIWAALRIHLSALTPTLTESSRKPMLSLSRDTGPM